MDATGYGFLLLVISIVVFIKFYLLGGGGAGGGKQHKREADLSEFDYKGKGKDDTAEVVGNKRKEPSSLRLRPFHKEEATPVAAAAVPKAKPQQEEKKVEEKKQEEKVVAVEEKKVEEVKKVVEEEVPKQEQEPEKTKEEEPAAAITKEDESAEEKVDAEKEDEAEEGDANAEDEDEDEEDEDDDDEDDDEEEEKDLHEVVNSASVPSSSTVVASVSLQGKRPKNEDRAVIQASTESHPEVSIFGIFDGHDGNKASEYCSKYMVKNITAQKTFPKSMAKAITQGFLKTDKKFLDKVESGGSTAIVAVLERQKNKKATLFVANAGDSRCVASVAGSAVPLSVDHKPDIPAEQERVNATTHEVQQSVEIVQGKRLKISRIDGTLAVSRAIGDGDFKDDPNKPQALQAVSPVPEIQTVEITPEHEFAVLACDGLWDVLSNQEVIDFVKSKISTVTVPDDLVTITKALVSHAVYEKQSTDNVTALIIKF